jgi:CRISPR-associated endonuclease/helicase Cas3
VISFAEFLRLAHGADVKPYPWQARLAERCAQSEPPSLIAVPTGAGKTTTIDALVWALAHQADRPAAERTVGVRIVWAIDRRILVDEVHKHAATLAQTLDDALGDEGDPLHDLAGRLAMISDAAPLVATRWRGGLEGRPERWGPLQPQVITSTIAQIGSRLLFRGYGVGRRSLAVEAGLAACDTTICLDEAHLAEPFRETVEAIRDHRKASERGLALPGLRTITLTATPSRDAGDALTIEDGDRLALGSRFTGQKRAVLVEPEPGEGEAAQVKRLVAAAASYVQEGSPTVACVVNTVRRARAVFDLLSKELVDEAEIALLVGPQRPADRDRMLKQHWGALFEGTAGKRPLVCVATQTFEVGLDADVAAMVTESASAMALVQRLGRLNRRGTISGRATIVRDEGSWLYAEEEPAAWEWLQGLVADDGAIDLSVAALAEHPPPQPSRTPCAATLTSEVVELLAQTAPSPGAWREPDPDVFLRGPEAKPVAEVALCWRSDLRPDRVGKEFDQYRSMLLKLVSPQRQELLTLSLTAARALLAARYPERRDQAASAAKAALLEADVEDSMRETSLPDPRRSHGMVPFVVLRGQEVHSGTLNSAKAGSNGAEEDEASAISPSAIRAGDIVVLPTSAGGADDNGLAPLQPRDEPASDVAPDRQPYGDPVPVRLTPQALAGVGEMQIGPKRWERIVAACAKAEQAIVNTSGQKARAQRVDRLIEHLRTPGLLAEHEGLGLLVPGSLRRDGWTVMLRSVTAADADGAPHLSKVDFGADELDDAHDAIEPEVDLDEVPPTDDSIAELRNPERVWVLLPIRVKDAENDDRHLGDEREPPTIDQHARAVGEKVKECAERLRLAPALTTALVLAARAHDHGKADARTQAFYRRGVYALAATPIAKSEFGTHDPRTARIATLLAGMPKRQRHEIASVAVLDDALSSGAVEMELNGADRDLALHVVGVHHGLGRPVPEMPEGGRVPRSFEIDAAGVAGRAVGDGRDGWANGAWLERFWQVFERYGPWGMAYLEALLVLSDRAVSAEGG